MMNKLNPYSVFIDLKNYLYDKKYFKQIQTKVKIISIGNLNTGGSGKTPMIQFIAEVLKDQKILIVCKSYKAKLQSPAPVNIQVDDCVKLYGDEACLLKQLLPHCDVWSGPSKSQTVRAALFARKDYDFVLIDDGFSHRQIFRHLDIVLVDASRNKNHYRLFPAGQMREDWKSLKRASLVVLTKTEGLSDSEKKYFIDQITKYQKKVITAKFKTAFISDLKLENKKLFLITGIGNPDKLKKDLEADGFQVLQQQIYVDHYRFPRAEQDRLLQKIIAAPDLQPVMTMKDLIKIQNQELKNSIKAVSLKISMTDEDRKLFCDKILS